MPSNLDEQYQTLHELARAARRNRRAAGRTSSMPAG